MKRKHLMKMLCIMIPMLILFFAVPSIFQESQFAVTKVTASTELPETENDIYDIELFCENLPQYVGEPFAIVNDDIPLFTDDEINSINDIHYSELDDLGRCHTAVGLIGLETVPNDKRGPIGDVRPTGWHTVRYDDRIEDRYLYNRCHLIGYQLAGANAEQRNLITGTRYLNMNGMLPLENKVLEYVIGTGNHVVYRVTPVFEEENLVASGLLMEAYSLEDEGYGIQFCRYLFNVQPGVIIDYMNGDSREDNTYAVAERTPDIVVFNLEIQNNETDIPDRSIPVETVSEEEQITYVLNTNTKRFHDPSCPSVSDMKEKNKKYNTDSREELIEQGYVPCGRCHP